MDSDYSDSESVTSTISESMHTTDLFDALELGKDPQAYKLDKNCRICSTKFGKIGIMHARKHYCKFCYRGVCAKCSPQVAVHPVQLKRLRVCNTCCQKAVINKFTENLKLEIDHVNIQQEQIEEKIEKSRKKKVEIADRIQELQRLYEQAMEMEMRFIQMKKSNFESEKKLKSSVVKRDESMTLQINSRLDLESLEKTLKNLENDKKAEGKKKELFLEEFLKARHELGEKQDDRVLILHKIEESKAKEEEVIKMQKGFEQIEKLRKTLDEVISQVESEQRIQLGLSEEVKKLQDENTNLDLTLNTLKIEETKLENPDSLVSTSKPAYNETEDLKISSLKKTLREKLAQIEHLKIQIKKSQPKVEDPLDIEMTSADKSRPCVRCLTF